ncbi:MAG: Dps family protein [Candidatus Dojkabacteria bacterium]
MAITYDASKIGGVIELLNDLLANYHVHFQKMRSYHWNVKGPSFFELHEKFEELYEDAYKKIDFIAERILALGGKPVSTFTEYLQLSELTESNGELADADMVQDTIQDLHLLIEKERLVAEKGLDALDSGTVEIIQHFIHEKEKLAWMLKASIS